MALEGAVTRCRFLNSSDGLLINCRFCDSLMWGEDDNAPMDCRRCSSFLACRKCYKRMESERTRCACGLQINGQSYGLARSLIEQQKSLHIYCQHKQLGCNWTGAADEQQEHFKNKCAPLLLKRARHDLENLHVEREILLSRNTRLIKEVQRLRKKLCKISSVCDDDGPVKKRKKGNESATRLTELDSSCYSLHSPAPESPCYIPRSPS